MTRSPTRTPLALSAPGLPAPGRRVVVLGGAAAATSAVLALAGCSRSDDRYATLGEDPVLLRADRATTMLEPVGDQAQALISSAGTWRVRGTLLADRFEAADAEALDGVFSDDGGEDVVAPDGQQFLLVRLEVEQQWWGGPTYAPYTVTGSSVVQATLDAEGTALDVSATYVATGTYLMRVPADPAPSDAVLTVVTDGKSQQLSLIDGTRVTSDVELLYGRHDEVVVKDGDRELADLNELYRVVDVDGPDGARTRLTAWPRQIFTAPVDVDGTWPETGTQILWISLILDQSTYGADDPASELDEHEIAQTLLRRLVLELDDGTAIEQTDLAPASDVLSGTWLRVEVPLAVESARCTLEVDPLASWEGLVEEIGDAAEVSFDLSFAPGPTSVA
ncbi:hypothetical protein ACXET9_08330 [Brachybacterium sp. DNPG3]